MTPVEQGRAFASRLREIREASIRRFEVLRQAGKVAGDFPAATWSYAGRNIRFDERAKKSTAARDAAGPLPGIAGILARCFIVVSIEQQLSSEGVYARLQGVRWLAEVTGGGIRRWLSLTPAVLNRVVSNLRNEHSIATVYNRASAISSFVDFLNGTRAGSDEWTAALLGRHIIWNHGLKNPIRASIEIKTDDVDSLGQRKYIPDLHRSLGQAHSRIKLNPELEPKPGYDLIRLEALAFMMATGMRAGELCALSARCLDTHEASGTLFVRVATEKGQPPSARPVAQIWSAAVSDAYDYLLERCASARAMAREIDTKGFGFVTSRLLEARRLQPIDPAFQAQLDVLGLQPAHHFQIAELAAAFDLSTKEFTSSGRFDGCLVKLPRKVAARVVRWMDSRMAAWDWQSFAAQYADPRTGQFGSQSLSASQIADYVGGGGACLAKAHWFYPELRSFLVDLSRAGALDGSGTTVQEREQLQRRWTEIRQQALGNVGGGQCTAVDIESFIECLAERYRAHLEDHYKDLISYSEEGVPITGAGVRLGVPRKLSDHLIVLWEGEFSGREANGILPRPMFRSDLYNYLSTNAQKRTIFERLGLLDSTGKPYSMSPHQIRHWVTTAIYRSGPQEMMVDLWMGRSAGQSRVYDHRTAKERAEVIRERYLSGNPPDDYLGRQVRLWTQSGLSAAELEEHVRSRLRVLHFVPTGGCSRELFLSPCTKGLMCLRGFGTGSACPSFHIDVTDDKAKANIIALRDQHRAMLAAVYPLASSLKEAFLEELNSTEVLDQHLIHMREVIRGCDQALAAYDRAESGGISAVKTIALRVIV